jgi:hypothetical protein
MMLVHKLQSNYQDLRNNRDYATPKGLRHFAGLGFRV